MVPVILGNKGETLAVKSYNGSKMIKKKSVRKLLQSSASLFGLAAGAVGWSGLARAESEDSQTQTLLFPEHYHLSDDGLVAFKLQTGEQLTLNPDQYTILQNGLLLITDEIAQASMQSLPVMGTIRAQLTSVLQPIRSPDGSVVQASDASPLWSGDGPAPRLFEQIDIQRYEVAQNNVESQSKSGSSMGQVTSAAAGGLSLAGISLVSGVLAAEAEESSDQAETSPAPASLAPPLPPSPPATSEYLSNTDFQALTAPRSYTGSSVDSFIGYSAASTSSRSPLTGASVASFDLSAGGNNHLLAAASAGAGTGNLFEYIGGSGDDTLEFGADLGGHRGTVTLTLGSGNNSVSAQDGAAVSFGDIDYSGGSGNDTLVFGHDLANSAGDATFSLGDGNNSLSAGNSAAGPSGGYIEYVGGSAEDTLTFGNRLAYGGTATFTTKDGSNSLSAGDSVAASFGALSYHGGNDADNLTFGHDLAANNSDLGLAKLNLGNGTNSLSVGNRAAANKGKIDYTSGTGEDTLVFGDQLAKTGVATFSMGNGENSLAAGDDAAYDGSLSYTGGTGVDDLIFGDQFAFRSTNVVLDLGSDTVADCIEFLGSVGAASGNVSIRNFDVSDGDHMTIAQNPINQSDFDASGADITWNRATDINITFEGLGSTGSNPISITALTASISIA